MPALSHSSAELMTTRLKGAILTISQASSRRFAALRPGSLAHFATGRSGKP